MNWTLNPSSQSCPTENRLPVLRFENTCAVLPWSEAPGMGRQDALVDDIVAPLGTMTKNLLFGKVEVLILLNVMFRAP